MGERDVLGEKCFLVCKGMPGGCNFSPWSPVSRRSKLVKLVKQQMSKMRVSGDGECISETGHAGHNMTLCGPIFLI